MSRPTPTLGPLRHRTATRVALGLTVAFGLTASLVAADRVAATGVAATTYRVLYSETFHFAAANPSTARAEFDRRFLTEVLGDNDGTWQGDHDMNCGAPTTHRTVAHNSSPAAYDDRTPRRAGREIWLCPPGDGHVMSDQGAADYSYTSFTPRRTFRGVRKVCWDVNLTTAGRAWWHVQLLPVEVYQETNRLSFDHPEFPGTPDFARARGGADPRPASFTFDFTQGLVGMYRGAVEHLHLEDQQGWFRSTDKASRFRNCMYDTAAGVTFTQVRPVDRWNRAGTYSWTQRGLDFPPGPVYVVFTAINYNSGKEGTRPQTWHWDNLLVAA